MSQEAVSSGGGETGIHPHILELLKWWVSCVWGVAALVLRRVLALPPPLPPLPAIAAAIERRTRGVPLARLLSAGERRGEAAACAPEPSVTCQVLRAPPGEPRVDVVFVHGLHGSLVNTWKQGQWKAKHKTGPKRLPLKRQHDPSSNDCNEMQPMQNPVKKIKNDQCTCEDTYNSNVSEQGNNKEISNEISKTTIERELSKSDLNYPEKKYDLNAIQEFLQNEYKKYLKSNVDSESEAEEENMSESEICNYILSKIKIMDLYDELKLYEPSDNASYESENDSLASKYNLSYFKLNDVIKKIYNTDEMTKNMADQNGDVIDEKESKMAELSNDNDSCQTEERKCEVGCGCTCSKCYSKCWPRDWLQADCPGARVISVNYTTDPYLWRPLWVRQRNRTCLQKRSDEMVDQLLELGVGKRPVVWVGHSKGGIFIKKIYTDAYNLYTSLSLSSDEGQTEGKEEAATRSRARLYAATKAFMFYSVPHRGSSLADIELPPVLNRSVELVEISKDYINLLKLQDAWLQAVAATEEQHTLSRPLVSSFVETSRTLMAVLWLRIVSVESADAGIGSLIGVDLDHREICKPSGRTCFLYRELLRLVAEVLDQQRHS